jgi:hypothetical protein
MFYRCKISIEQDSKMTEIILLQQEGMNYQEGVTFFGKYKPVGKYNGNIPEKQMGWRLVVALRELRLINNVGAGEGMVGAGQEFLEVAPMEPFAVLSGAVLSERGIEPATGNTPAGGKLTSGSAVDASFHQGDVTWRLSGYRSSAPGTNAWVTP